MAAIEQLEVSHTISDPERCSRILAVRFLKTRTTVAEEAQHVEHGGPAVTQC